MHLKEFNRICKNFLGHDRHLNTRVVCHALNIICIFRMPIFCNACIVYLACITSQISFEIFMLTTLGYIYEHEYRQVIPLKWLHRGSLKIDCCAPPRGKTGSLQTSVLKLCKMLQYSQILLTFCNN